MRKLNLLEEALDGMFFRCLATFGPEIGPMQAGSVALGMCDLLIVACADHREWAERWANEVRADPNPHSASVSAREFVESIPWPE